MDLKYEKNISKSYGTLIAGMDEVGRGPIAGPVAVGVVLIDLKNKKHIARKKFWSLIKDSKKLSAKQRERAYKFIENNFPFGVGMVSVKMIDKYGINPATEIAAKRALSKLKIKPNLILLDGNRKFKKINNFSQECIIGGDAKVLSIAAASIMAKVTRDNWMVQAGKRWPKYQFEKHKGYCTSSHIKLLELFGFCPLHRMSFAPLKFEGFQKSFSKRKLEILDDKESFENL